MKAVYFLVWLALAVPGWSQERATDAVVLIPTVEESSSGEAFPVLLRPHKNAMHTLVSTGIRKKFIFKVYAFGLYLDQFQAQSQLEKWSKNNPVKLAKDKKFMAALLSGKISMTVRWVMQRDVDAEDIAEAFVESLQPRIDALLKPSKGAGEKELAQVAKRMKETHLAFDTFRKFFAKDEIKEGTELIFTWLPAGIFRTSVGGIQQRDVQSAVLSQAFFDVYLGTDPVTRLGREDFLAGLADFLTPPKSAQTYGQRK